jgi:hypothetical protein
MSASSMPSCFPRRIDLLENLFLITSLLDLFFLLFSFLDTHTGHPAHHDARILLYQCISDALLIFSSSFRSIGSLLPIGDHSTSLHLARLQTGRLLSLLVLFSFGLTCMLFDLSIAPRLRHDHSKVVAPTPRLGASETWVPLGPH